MQHYDEGQDQESLYAKVSEVVVGNEESGQASASSTTTVATTEEDNDTDNEDVHSNRTRSSTRSMSSVIANIRPSEDSDSAAEINDVHYDGNGNLVLQTNQTGDPGGGGGGGGDWFTNVGHHNPNEPFTFTDFLVHYLIAAAVAIALVVVSGLIEDIFQHPGNIQMHPPHQKRRRRGGKVKFTTKTRHFVCLQQVQPYRKLNKMLLYYYRK